MNCPTRILASLLLFSLTSTAETLRFKGKLAGEQTTGSATVDFHEPSMQLVAGDKAWALKGYPLEFGEYLFVEVAPRAGLATIQAEVLPTKELRAVVVASLLNVRPAPTRHSTPLRQAKGGESLALTGVTSGPWLALTDGGWVHGARRFVRRERVYDADSIQTTGMALRLRSNSRGYYGTIRGSSDVLRFVNVVANEAPRVLLIPALSFTTSEERMLKGYALKLERYYAQRGVRSDLHQADTAPGVIRFLEDAALAGRRYSRVIWIGHGGWDGPMMGFRGTIQVSARDHAGEFAAFIAALDEVLTPDAKLFASSCHAAGSNKYEKAKPLLSHYNWVHDVALRTGRTVAGPAGSTSTEYTYQQVLAVLEGQGSVVQEVHVATGTTLQVVWPGRTLAEAKTQDLPKIDLTSNPAPPTVNSPLGARRPGRGPDDRGNPAGNGGTHDPREMTFPH